jgi:hypothetical protein
MLIINFKPEQLVDAKFDINSKVYGAWSISCDFILHNRRGLMKTCEYPWYDSQIRLPESMDKIAQAQAAQSNPEIPRKQNG